MSSPFDALSRLFRTDRRAPATPPPPAPVEETPPTAVEQVLDLTRDQLTGLYSASGIEDVLAKAIEEATASGELIAVGYVGLDGLAHVHEEYGRLISDQVVREIGRRIGEAVREVDVVGRITLDEYLIVFRGLANRIEAMALGARLRVQIAEPVRAGRITYTPLASCGVAHHPADGTTVAALRAKAQATMQTMTIALREAVARKAREDAERAAREAAEREAAAAAEKAAAEAAALAETAGEAAPATTPEANVS